MQKSQNLGNHARLHPPFHFVLIPLLLANLAFAIYTASHHWPENRSLLLGWIAMSIALLLLALIARMYSVKVQDRVIRMEERLRYAALLPPEELEYSRSLTVAQIIALRFASDAELPALVKQTSVEGLKPRSIKEKIVHWRGDFLRV